MSEMGVKSRHAAISDACPLYPGGTVEVLRNQGGKPPARLEATAGARRLRDRRKRNRHRV